MLCSEDTKALLSLVKWDLIFEFLGGLNAEFDQVRIQILGKKWLPLLNEVFFIIYAEESRRTVMLESQISKSSAMVSVKVADERSLITLGKGKVTEPLIIIPLNSPIEMGSGIPIVKSPSIQKKSVLSFVEKHKSLVEMEDLKDGREVRPTSQTRKIPLKKNQSLMVMN